jgi:predicted PurR-regulated permease PerM
MSAELSRTDPMHPSRLFDVVLRLGTVGVLLFMAMRAVAPFVEILIWGVVLAVTLAPAHGWLMARMGDSSRRAAAVLTIAGVLFIVGPSFLLGDALGTTAHRVAQEIRGGDLSIPPPPDSVMELPVVGKRIHEGWHQASTNLDGLLERSSDRVVALGGRLVRTAGAAVLGILQFTGSLIVAGVLLGRRKASADFAARIFARLAPEAGDRLFRLTEQTVRGVAAGVIGVAIIQAVLIGLGLLVAGFPLAGVWSLLCLLVGIVQLPMGLVVIPLVIYQFSHAPLPEASLLAAYMLPVMLVDNVLKPILMGRGVEAPMLVIFVGALGGFAASGFIGLFTGAIVLVLANELLTAWLRPEVLPAPE